MQWHYLIILLRAKVVYFVAAQSTRFSTNQAAQAASPAPEVKLSLLEAVSICPLTV